MVGTVVGQFRLNVDIRDGKMDLEVVSVTDLSPCLKNKDTLLLFLRSMTNTQSHYTAKA